MPLTICSEPKFIKIWLDAYEANETVAVVAKKSGLTAGTCFRKKDRINARLEKQGLEHLPRLKSRDGTKRASLRKVDRAIKAAISRRRREG